MNEHWTVRVDRELCRGTGVCAGTAPRYFRLVNGRSQPVDHVVDPDEIVLDAAASCPTEAIAIEDDSGHRLAP